MATTDSSRRWKRWIWIPVLLLLLMLVVLLVSQCPTNGVNDSAGTVPTSTAPEKPSSLSSNSIDLSAIAREFQAEEEQEKLKKFSRYFCKKMGTCKKKHKCSRSCAHAKKRPPKPKQQSKPDQTRIEVTVTSSGSSGGTKPIRVRTPGYGNINVAVNTGNGSVSQSAGWNNTTSVIPRAGVIDWSRDNSGTAKKRGKVDWSRDQKN